MSEFADETKETFSKTSEIVEGVASGFLIMLVPLLAIGVAVGLGLFVLKLPQKALNGGKTA